MINFTYLIIIYWQILKKKWSIKNLYSIMLIFINFVIGFINPKIYNTNPDLYLQANILYVIFFLKYFIWKKIELYKKLNCSKHKLSNIVTIFLGTP